MQPELIHLATMIRDKIGIDMLKNTESLERKLAARLQELDVSVWGYVQYVKKNPTEWDRIIDYITINETYFFREEEQLDEFKKTLQSITKKHVRIWSAACSMGEEAYTLAIIAKETLPAGTTVEIIATDINEDVLDTAKLGIYSKNSLSFRRLPADKIARYFDEVVGGYQIKETYKNMVKFSSFNLVDTQKWIFMREFDVIFCRNVLIYFDEETNKQVIEQFYESLGEKGMLFLGHSDPYRQIYTGFKFIRTPKTLYLQKGETQ